ncbi:MAG: hypothetical protein LBC48_06730 [Dysgonamonadaceae bacterium]|jgi:hypothetical protein|nr:hypothetical protein [Dysgonamonadaceae bacterium]
MKNFIISILFICIVFSCKEEIYSTIPTAPVSYKLNLNLYPVDNQLNAGTGAYLCITQKRLETDRLGYGGLLVVNGIGEDVVNIYAYDLACPNEANRDILVVPENISKAGIPTAITAKCPKCGAVYNIVDGYKHGDEYYGYGIPQSGSKYYLRAYRVVKTASMEFVVTN